MHGRLAFGQAKREAKMRCFGEGNSAQAEAFSADLGITIAKGHHKGGLLLWWTRGELNPCPKTSSYNFLRG